KVRGGRKLAVVDLYRLRFRGGGCRSGELRLGANSRDGEKIVEVEVLAAQGGRVDVDHVRERARLAGGGDGVGSGVEEVQRVRQREAGEVARHTELKALDEIRAVLEGSKVAGVCRNRDQRVVRRGAGRRREVNGGRIRHGGDRGRNRVAVLASQRVVNAILKAADIGPIG